MKNLFVEKSLEINAPASRVWGLLTHPALIKEWVKEWWPDFGTIESNWKLGSAPKPVNETFRLKERDGHTMLVVSIGDFGNDPALKRYYYPRAMENWDKYFLPKIKELAEK